MKLPLPWMLLCVLSLSSLHAHSTIDEHPFSKINILKASPALSHDAAVSARPILLGLKGEDQEWVTVRIRNFCPTSDDWIGVFSPANFNGSDCSSTVDPKDQKPYICSSPIKYKFVNLDNPDYPNTGNAIVKFLLINQRADFSFGLFSGGLSNPKLVAVTYPPISFVNPKAPVYPRLAIGKSWNEMTVTWTSGYSIDEAYPLVEYGLDRFSMAQAPAGTLTFSQNTVCGAPANTVGWRHPGYIHTSFLKDLWPNRVYTYRIGHLLLNGKYVWSKSYKFRASPYPGQDSLQQIVVFGDMGKGERDGSNEYSNYQPGALNTTDQIIKDIDNIDAVFHIGDLAYANGYLSEWDQFTSQIEPIASVVPYMVASGNHERDWPNTGSFYDKTDSGGECGVPAETMFYYPAENKAKFWYQADYGMFRFCVADTEHDWREGTEQYKFIEHCLATADRQKQPWLIFTAHRVLGYSSDYYYGLEGAFEEPMGRESLQKLWQRYRVDLAFYGHVHNYERSCPVYQHHCTRSEKDHYSGSLNGTIHVVVGGAGSHLSQFSPVETRWSLVRDYDHGFVKLTAFNHSSLLFEYKKSSDGSVFDSFTVSRDYKDILGCMHDACESTTLAT